MPQYVALLRGIGPTNPHMRNDKLCGVLADIGCSRIQPVLASGNIVFTSTLRNSGQLESKYERVLHQNLGLSLDVIVRGEKELTAMVRADPFKGAEHGKEWYLTVTFFKDGRAPVYSKFKRATLDGPGLMADLEKRYGKHITTRTWNTIQKILAKMAGAGTEKTASTGAK
jgi:uncharacterized protein (DUF1697 family)